MSSKLDSLGSGVSSYPAIAASDEGPGLLAAQHLHLSQGVYDHPPRATHRLGTSLSPPQTDKSLEASLLAGDQWTPPPSPPPYLMRVATPPPPALARAPSLGRPRSLSSSGTSLSHRGSLSRPASLGRQGQGEQCTSPPSPPPLALAHALSLGRLGEQATPSSSPLPSTTPSPSPLARTPSLNCLGGASSGEGSILQPGRGRLAGGQAA